MEVVSLSTGCHDAHSEILKDHLKLTHRTNHDFCCRSHYCLYPEIPCHKEVLDMPSVQLTMGNGKGHHENN